MALIAEKDQAFLREKFDQELTDAVTIKLFTQRETRLTIPGLECPYCPETNQLMEEVAALSEKITLEAYDFAADAATFREHNIERIPAIVLRGRDSQTLRFFGIPSGYEFPSFIQDILELSTGQLHLSQATVQELQAIDQDVHIQVFVTPT